jgi:glycosyltransferase involved in cell wall biosynthesis
MKISIITINFNNVAGLKATLDSVAKQVCREFEHIIIDGGSNDGSVEIIREYESIISNRKSIILKWVSEPDKGIYDGMNKGVEIASGIRVVNALNRSEFLEDKNKGVSKASGEYVYFLNSGDTLPTESTLQEMIDAIDGSDFVIGRVNKTYQGRIVGQTDLLKEADMSMYQMYLHGINHQSAIIRRTIQMEHLYDATLKIGADWKFFVETIVLGGAKVKFVDKIFANYDVSGVSSNTAQLRQEREKIMVDILPERIAQDYLTIAPHYYEVTRVEWLLRHPFWYKLYRGMTTFARKMNKVQ